MSQTETHKGRLVPMNLLGPTLEDKARQACCALGLKREETYHDSWVEALEDEGYKKVIIHNDTIYRIEDTEVEPNGFVEGSKNEDGTYEYFVSYYNGGASLSEVLESAIAKAEKTKPSWVK